MSFLNSLSNVQLALDRKEGGEEIERIPLDRITSDPSNPRQDFDQAELEALAQSIKERGLLQPITLRPHPDRPQRFIVRFGDRRFRAAALAGLTEIQAIITETPEDGDLLDQVVENEQRVGLSNSDMGQAVSRLAEQELTQRQIADRIGRPQSTVAQYASIASMPEGLARRANEADLRALYDLHKLWLKSPELVERFLAAGEAIIRSAVKKLAEGTVNSSHTDGSLGNSAQSMATAKADSEGEGEMSEVVAPTPKQQSLSHVAVRVEGRSGRLILPATVKVLFDGEGSFVTVRTESLTN